MEKALTRIKGDETQAIRSRIKDIDKFLDPSLLESDDDNLSETLTLGDNWDDPLALSKAMDEHPSYFARWSYIYRATQRRLKYHNEKYNTWVAKKKKQLEKELYDENIDKGISPNNSKVSITSVENAFNAKYNDKCKIEFYLKLRKNVMLYEERVEKIKIVIEALKQRSVMLVSMSSLLKSMVDNNLLVHKMKRKTK
jgi:hypothetical protein